MGELEGAVGDLEAGLGIDPTLDPVLTDVMDWIAAVARRLAEKARDQAIACDLCNSAIPTLNRH